MHLRFVFDVSYLFKDVPEYSWTDFFPVDKCVSALLDESNGNLAFFLLPDIDPQVSNSEDSPRLENNLFFTA